MDVKYNGDLLEITCSVAGPSLPSFMWKNGSEILSLSPRVKIETNENVSKVFIRKFSTADAGYYVCVAR